MAERPIFAPQTLPYRMKLLVQLMTRRFQAELDPFGLTPLHWGILGCLWQEDGQATQAIANHIEQLGGTITVGLDTMERRGLIERKPDPADRRISRVWLTTEGRELQDKLVPRVVALQAKLFECFSDRDYEEFSRLLDVMREHVEKDVSVAEPVAP